MARQWQAYEMVSMSEDYLDIAMHRHEYHDVVVTRHKPTGRWTGILRVSSVSRSTQELADISDFSKPQELPEFLVLKLAGIAIKEVETCKN